MRRTFYSIAERDTALMVSGRAPGAWVARSWRTSCDPTDIQGEPDQPCGDVEDPPADDVEPSQTNDPPKHGGPTGIQRDFVCNALSSSGPSGSPDIHVMIWIGLHVSHLGKSTDMTYVKS